MGKIHMPGASSSPSLKQGEPSLLPPGYAGPSSLTGSKCTWGPTLRDTKISQESIGKSGHSTQAALEGSFQKR